MAIENDNARLAEELRRVRTKLDQVEEELRTIRESPGWRLIERWRSWVARKRDTLAGRLADNIGRSVLRASSGKPAVAEEVHPRAGETRPPARLIVCPDAPFSGKVFYVADGRRHWAPSVGHLECYGLRLEDAEVVSKEVVASFANAGQLPRIWPESAWNNPVRTSFSELREIALSRLYGTGVEFGAGTYPVSVPLECKVKFADHITEAELKRVAYVSQGSDFVPLDYLTSLEDMDGIEDGSLDFAIACHVIEHVRNPLKAMESAYRKLRPGGQFVLMVPDKTRTFDRPRGVTPLRHLIDDYESPDIERDAEDYRDFFVTVNNFSPEQVEEAIVTKRDLHFHTWTYESFGETVEYARKTMIAPWSDVWSQPAIEGDSDSIEFYFVLVK